MSAYFPQNKAKTYAIRWAYSLSSFDALLGISRPNVILLDATDRGVSEFVDYIETQPNFTTPIIALAKNSQMQSELDQRIPDLVKARIDSSRIGRSLLSRTIRQVVAAAVIEDDADKAAVMEVQGVRVNTNARNRLTPQHARFERTVSTCAGANSADRREEVDPYLR